MRRPKTTNEWFCKLHRKAETQRHCNKNKQLSNLSGQNNKLDQVIPEKPNNSRDIPELHSSEFRSIC
ncbi:hypothetical protein RIF29_24886 [Crotalaria pallida]|uniref:Uncharacterized protein n=1 Tax=Crotalaria pallida TaxID=3830 RepID=A0AAN9HZB0_CROPI